MNHTSDEGLGSLRHCLDHANNGNSITFDPSVFPPNNPVTITLTSALPAISQGNLTIDASNAGVILDCLWKQDNRQWANRPRQPDQRQL